MLFRFLLVMIAGFTALPPVVAQPLFKGGPMLGDVDFRSAVIWVEMDSAVKQVRVSYRENKPGAVAVNRLCPMPQTAFNSAKIVLTGLNTNSNYLYTISAGTGKNAREKTGSFTTRELWQWRKPAPDFSFLAGSCAYFNEPVYDRPGTPYGKDSSIFEVMARDSAAFMVWLGDNWYTREVDYSAPWGLNYRASLTRSYPVLQNFLKAMPQYAIWDDHDYGPDNSDKTYPLKNESRSIFERYWCNPSFGEAGQGIYTRLSWNDVDLFLLDDRWFRSNDAFADSVNGAPNPQKRMLGAQQMEWLKNALAGSGENPNISFRIIAIGSQVLNPLSSSDCLRHYPGEYQELLNMLAELKTEGVVFLSGDRHLSEIIKQERPHAYPLYDITTSPLTAGPNRWNGAQLNNPFRVCGVDGIQNYARFSISGTGAGRQLNVAFVDKTGQPKASWSVKREELGYGKGK